MGRPTLRNPNDPHWPERGERTEFQDIAERWKWAYVELAHGAHRNRVLGRSEARTLKPSVEAYLEHRRNTVEARTHLNDQTVMRHLVEYASGPVHLVDVQGFVHRLLENGYRPSTVKQYAHALAAFWRWCGLEMPDVAVPNPGAEDTRVLTDTEIARLRAAAGDFLLPVDIGLHIGLRRGEILGLRGEDFGEYTVRVQRQVGQDTTHTKPLKGKRARTALILDGWTHPPTAGPLVPLTTYVATKRLNAVLDDAGLNETGMGWHVLRHTYARRFLERGGSLEQLKASLGHSSIVTTETAYGHLQPDVAARLARERMKQGP